MILNYLSVRYIYILLFVIFCLALLSLYLWASIFCLLMFILLFIYRRKHTEFLEESAIKRDVVFSPINGKVKKITYNQKRDRYELRLSSKPFKELGIYLPIQSEVKESLTQVHENSFTLLEKLFGKSLDKADETILRLLGIHQEYLSLHFKKNLVGQLPYIEVRPGDRGKSQVNIGFMPILGQLVLSLPKNYEILVNENDDVEGGVTPIAGMNKE